MAESIVERIEGEGDENTAKIREIEEGEGGQDETSFSPRKRSETDATQKSREGQTAEEKGTKAPEKDSLSEEEKRKQVLRTRIVAGTVIFVYFFMGCVAMDLLEGWTAIDSIYFAIATATTVGYGDLAPNYDGSKLFVTFYALIGVIFAAAGFGVLFETILEFQEKATIEALKAVRDVRRGGRRPSFSRLLENEDIEVVEPEDGSLAGAGLLKTFTACKCSSNWIIIAIHILIGMLIFQSIEKTTFVDAFYWATITMLTVGYGDIHPKSEGGRVFACFYMIISLGIVTRAIGKFVQSTSSIHAARQRKRIIRALFQQAVEGGLVIQRVGLVRDEGKTKSTVEWDGGEIGGIALKDVKSGEDGFERVGDV